MQLLLWSVPSCLCLQRSGLHGGRSHERWPSPALNLLLPLGWLLHLSLVFMTHPSKIPVDTRPELRILSHAKGLSVAQLSQHLQWILPWWSR